MKRIFKVVGWAIALVCSSFIAASADKIIEWAIQKTFGKTWDINPVPAATVVILVALIALLAWDRTQGRILARLMYQLRAARWAGITQVYPVAPFPTDSGQSPEYDQEVRNKADEALREMTRSVDQLQIMAASGWRLIGTSQVPGLLYEALSHQSKGFKLEILLLDPDSDPGRARAKAQKILSAEQYREGVMAILWTLRRWKREHHIDVKVYLFDEEPIWQMVMSHAEIWLLCATKNVSAGRSPVYCLRRNTPYGLAFGVEAVWARRKVRATEYELDKMTEPNWSLVSNVMWGKQTEGPPAPRPATA